MKLSLLSHGFLALTMGMTCLTLPSCITIDPNALYDPGYSGGGYGGGGGRPSDRPDDRPDQRRLPRPLRTTLKTHDSADYISVRSEVDESLPLEDVVIEFATGSGIEWWKGFGVDRREPSVEITGAGRRALRTVSPDAHRISLWKAKAFGVHTPVGNDTLDLTNYGGHRVIVTWEAD